MNKKEFNQRMEKVYALCKVGELSCCAMGEQFYTYAKYREFLKKCFPGFSPFDSLQGYIAIDMMLTYEESRPIAIFLRLLTITMYWQECLATKAYLNF